LTKLFFKTVCLLLAGLTIYSCSKNEDSIVAPVSPENFKYPYSINSNWFFTTTPYYIFHPDSVSNYITDLDTAIETGYAVWKNDTVIEGINARVLRTNHTSTAHAYNTTECYVQTDTGLVNLSFDSDGVSFGPFRPNPNYTLLYNGKNYSSIGELKQEFFSESQIITDNSVLNNYNCIKYPIVENTEWFFRYTSLNPVQLQRKKYLSYEQVQTPAGIYNCIKIQRKGYRGNPEVPDTNYNSMDYFSKVGMVKRSFALKNIAFVYKGALIGYFDIGQEVILNSVDIH